MSEREPARCDFDLDELIVKLEAVLPARVDAISPVVAGIMDAVRELGCAHGGEFEVELALHEALANAVVHGCGGDEAKQVEVVVACDDQQGLLIIVRDPGPGFDPSQIPCPVLAENLFRSHGRGIFLINELMDEVSFARGGTEIRMRKRNP